MRLLIGCDKFCANCLTLSDGNQPINLISFKSEDIFAEAYSENNERNSIISHEHRLYY